MTLSTDLVATLLELRRAGIPDAIRDKTRLHIADAVGIAVAARERSDIAEIVRSACYGPGARRPDGPGSIDALPPAFIAFATSAFVHTLDFDDIHDSARIHPTAVTLPAALAVSSISDASGTDLVDAVAISNELLCRMGKIWLPVGHGPGSEWFLTQLCGYFAAALAACIVLRMSAEQTRAALGLAYMQAAGGKEPGFGTGSNSRSIYPAFAAMGGVHAALLARAGMIGTATALDGAAGFFRLYFGRDLDAEQLAQLLSRDRWVWKETQIKPWPSCRHSHPYVFAAQALRQRVADVTAIQKVLVKANRSAGRLCTPIEERRQPRTLQDAKYSIPFIVAFTLVRGEVSLNTLNESALGDRDVLALAQRLTVDETLPDEPGLPHASISVQTGNEVISFAERFNVPTSESMACAKFAACLDYAGLAAHAEPAWNSIMNLDQSDCRAVVDLMRVGATHAGS